MRREEDKKPLDEKPATALVRGSLKRSRRLSKKPSGLVPADRNMPERILDNDISSSSLQPLVLGSKSSNNDSEEEKENMEGDKHLEDHNICPPAASGGQK